MEQKICLGFNFSFVPRTSPLLQCWSGKIISTLAPHRFKVLFFTMLLPTANFLTHMKEEHQSSNLEVCKGLRTIENKFLQPGLALSGSLDILRRGTWKPVRAPTCWHRHRWPSSEVKVYCQGEWRQTGEIKKQVANNPVGLARDLGVSSLPHSLHESFFQSVHTHSPFFHRPPPYTPIHPPSCCYRIFLKCKSKFHLSPCCVNSSRSSQFSE